MTETNDQRVVGFNVAFGPFYCVESHEAFLTPICERVSLLHTVLVQTLIDFQRGRLSVVLMYTDIGPSEPA